MNFARRWPRWWSDTRIFTLEVGAVGPTNGSAPWEEVPGDEELGDEPGYQKRRWQTGPITGTHMLGGLNVAGGSRLRRIRSPSSMRHRPSETGRVYSSRSPLRLLPALTKKFAQRLWRLLLLGDAASGSGKKPATSPLSSGRTGPLSQSSSIGSVQVSEMSAQATASPIKAGDARSERPKRNQDEAATGRLGSLNRQRSMPRAQFPQAGRH
jgi:hypothetical protein